MGFTLANVITANGFAECSGKVLGKLEIIVLMYFTLTLFIHTFSLIV